MGNQSSSSSSPIDIERLRHFSRNGGSLGLSRTELDKRCQPSGLYGSCNWDDKVVRRLISDGKIAARLKGEEYPDPSSGCNMEECPICFLSYSAVNITRCCNAVICTECYLQVRPQKEKDSACPFCNCENFSVTISKKKSLSLVPGTISSASSMTTASVSASSSCSNVSEPTANTKKKSTASVAPHTPPTTTSKFGSELEKDERFKRFKKRSESFASTEGSSTPKKDREIMESIAMTTEERQRLEEEMKAQHCHPLVLKIEAEAEERRLENDRAYRRSTSGNNSRTQATGNRRLLRVRSGSARNVDQLANFLEGDDNDDLSALERAIIHSIGQGERGSRGSANSNNDSSTQNDLDQQEGFPLLRSLLTGRLDIHNGNASSISAAASRRSTWYRRQRHPHSAFASSSLMALSEEEQIAMAIAASMQDQEQQSAQNDDSNEDGSDNDETAEEESNETDPGNNSENEDSNTITTPDNEDPDADGVSVASSAVASQQCRHQGNGDEASTITELARVVTDSRSPNVDTGITA